MRALAPTRALLSSGRCPEGASPRPRSSIGAVHNGPSPQGFTPNDNRAAGAATMQARSFTSPAKPHRTLVRVGLPLVGGQLVRAARERGYPVLFSANAFARTYPAGHERAGDFRGFRLPDPAQFDGLDAALDSAGFVAAAHYGDYRWTVEDYLDLVAAHPWAWWSSMDMCCEPEVAGDRPLRLLRIAATAYLLGQCRREATDRGLSMPMPILQGFEPRDYALCAQWLPLLEWPRLVGLGSVCRRHVHGPHGLLAVLEAVDRVLPPHVRLHLFGVKSSALQLLAGHPRIESCDSMAWDLAARTACRTGRDMGVRIAHMEAWARRQQRVAAGSSPAVQLQASLFDPADFAGLGDAESRLLEALAWQHAELVQEGALEYRAAVWDCVRDGPTAVAMWRAGARGQDFDELIAGLGERFEALHQAAH